MEDFVTSWDSHYQMEKEYHDPPRVHASIETAVTLQSRSQYPEDFPRHIDDFHCPEDGVPCLDDFIYDSLFFSLN